MKYTLYLVLLLAFSPSAEFTQAKESFDAGAITQWQDKWSLRPIEASITNISSTNVTITFNFRISTELPIGSVAEIHFPSQITTPSSPSIHQFVEIQKANSEISVQVTGVTLPDNSQAIGPFMIYTRKAEGGQIADMTRGFGSLFVTEAFTEGELTVSLVQGTTIKINTETSLFFEIDVTNDVWIGDIFTINIDDDWYIGNTPTCESIVDSESNQLFVSHSGTNYLDCLVSDRTVYVYGNSREIDREVQSNDNKIHLKLKVSDFTSPSSHKESTEYTWAMHHWSLNYNRLLRKWTGTGVITSPGELILSNWTPSNGIAFENIVQNLTLYMDLTVRTEHWVNSGGIISLTFTAVDIKSAFYIFDQNQQNGSNDNYCYIHYSVAYTVECEITSTTSLNLKASQAIDPGTEITFSLLCAFNGPSPSVKGTSYIALGAQSIDNSNLLTLSYGLQSSALKLYSYQFIVAKSFNQNPLEGEYFTGANDPNFINFAFATSVGSTLTGSMNLQLYLPANTNGFEDHSIWLKSLFTNFSLANNPNLATDSSGNYGSNASPHFTLQQATAESNLISFNIPDITDYDGAIMFFYNYDGTAVDQMYLPKVQSNLWTRYETYLIVKAASSNVQYIQFQQIHFQANQFDTSSYQKHCYNLVQVTFLPLFDSTQKDDQTYQIEIIYNSSYSDYLGSNLQVNEVYPHRTVNFTQPTIMHLSGKRSITLSGETQFITTITYEIWTSVENSDFSSNSATLKLQFINNSDPNIKHVMLSSTLNINDSLTDLGTVDDLGNQLLNTAPIQAGTEYQTFVLNDEYLQGVQTPQNFYMQLPFGFDITDSVIQLLDSNTGQASTIMESFKISAPNRLFSYPILVMNTICSDDACQIQVTGAKVTQWTQPSVKIWYGDSNQCGSDVQYSIVTGVIDILDLNTTIKSRGPENYHEDLTIQLILQHGILQPGGSLSVTLDDGWAICPTSKIFIQGLNNEKIQMAVGSQEILITGFDQINGSQQLDLKLTNLMPPENTGTTDITARIVYSALSTYSYNQYSGDIDYVVNPSANLVVTPKAETGVTTVEVIQAIPNNLSIAGADFYMKFALSKNIPAGADIIIEAPTSFQWLSQTELNNYVFFSKLYQSITAENNILTISVKEDIQKNVNLELYVEEAFDTPANPSNAWLFKIKTVYTCGQSTITFDDDTLNSQDLDLGHTLIIPQSSSSALTNAIITNTNSTAGEISEYIFSFTTSQEQLVETDQIWIKFPYYYDKVVQAYWNNNDFVRYPWQEPNIYYVECSSEVLGANVECTVKHRIVRVFNIEAVQPNTQVTITINKVQNPGIVTTPATFKIYHIDYEGNALAKQENLNGLVINAPASNIYIQSVSKSNNHLFQLSDYNVNFFLDGISLQTGYSFQLYLPRQYNTNLIYGNTEENPLACSAVYFDVNDYWSEFNDPDNTGTEIRMSQCTLKDNIIQGLLETIDDIVFDYNYKISWTINGLTNPSWGTTREKQKQIDRNYDAWDQKNYYIWQSWTYQLKVGLFSGTDNSLISISYPNVNSSYLGFDHKPWSFQVNSYSQQYHQNYLKVYSGTQSIDYAIKTSLGHLRPLGADKMVFTPSTNTFALSSPELNFVSATHNFTMYTTEYEIQFRIGASQATDYGVYYIDWGLTETKLGSATYDQYDLIGKTMIQVSNKLGQVPFTMTPNRLTKIEAGTTSFPIKVTTLFAPHTDVNLLLSLSNPDLESKVTLNRTTLNFIPNRNTQYFTISIVENYDASTEPNAVNILFTLGGTNAEVYTPPQPLIVEIEAQKEAEDVLPPVLKAEEISRVTAKLQINTPIPGIVYWHCAPSGNQEIIASTLKTDLSNYFKMNESTVTIDNVLRQPIEVKPADNDQLPYAPSWTAFQYRLYKNHLMNDSWQGAFISLSTEDQTLTVLKQLWADTRYTCWAFLEDNKQAMSEITTITFITHPIPDAARLFISFTGNVPIENIEDVKVAAAIALGVQPSRLINGLGVNARNASQEIVTSTFQWDLPAYRNIQGPEPKDIIKIADAEVLLMVNQLQSKNINLIPSHTGYKIEQSAYAQPDWVIDRSPRLSEKSSKDKIVITAACRAAGFICTVCISPQQNINPNHNQILLGLDVSNKQATNYYCFSDIPANQSIEFELNSLSTDDNLKCYVQCFNNYPTWPGYVNYYQSPIESVDVSTDALIDVTGDDSAEWITSLLVLALVI